MFAYLAKRKIKSKLLRTCRVRRHCFCDYRNIKKLVLLYEYDQLPLLSDIIKDMEKDGISVHSFVLNLIKEPKGEQPVLPYKNVTMIRRDQLLMNNQLVKPAMVKEFLKHDADAVMDLTVRECLPVLYLMSLSKVSLKMGYRKNVINPCDFMIQTDEPITPAELAKNLIFYLKRIDIKNNNL